MSETDPKKGWTEAGLEAVISWFPDLPRWVKVIFAAATIYLILCLVAQIPPLALPQAAGSALTVWADRQSEIADHQRRQTATERADLIALLMEQNRELRQQAADDPELARRVHVLEQKMAALLEGHPADRARYESMR